MNHSDDLLQRAEQRRQTAEAILRDLDLMSRWRRFGRPVLVGALAIDVAVAPDIDMEIYCPESAVCALALLGFGAKFVYDAALTMRWQRNGRRRCRASRHTSFSGGMNHGRC